MTTAAKRWVTLTAVCLAIVSLGWVVASAELSSAAAPIPKAKPLIDRSQQSQSEQDSSSQAVTGSARPGTSNTDLTWVGDVLVTIMYTLLGAAVLALLAFALYRIFTTRPSLRDVETRAAAQPDTAELREALRAGLSDIDAGGDPRKAVIACWLRLERVATETGVARLASETPSDLVARVLASSNVGDQALRELVEAYHRARYSPHDITEDERAAARAALSYVDEQMAFVDARSQAR